MANMKRVARFERRPPEILVDYEDVFEEDLPKAIERLLHGPATKVSEATEDCVSHYRGAIILQVIDYDPEQDPYRTLGKVLDGMTFRRRVPEDDD